MTSNEEIAHSTAWKIEKITAGLEELLLEKNKRYGDSALSPLGVFNRSKAKNSLYVRIDDKINRIKNSKEVRKNDTVDLIGYLILLCVNNDWLSFKELID